MSSNPHKEHTPEWYAFEAGRAAILDVELKYLKELQALRSSSFVTAVPSEDYDKLVQENFDIAFDLREMERANARLKAEVERLEGLVKYWQIEAETDHAHWVRHAETNERLRKAGDAMEQRLLLWHDDDYSSIWNAAKEGKQS